MSKRKLILHLFFIFIITICPIYSAPKTDIVIFSYNRPMQLYALLESIDYYVKGVGKICIIYRAASNYQQGYDQVMHQFPNATFVYQDAPPHDFKRLTLECTFKTDNDYILFAVDDDLVKDFIDLEECAQLIEKHHAYGFYLRLGKNLSYCYSRYEDQKLPVFITDQDNLCSWQFSQGECDWNYPHNLDMTLYRKSDLASLLTTLEYSSPNSLEYQLALQADVHKVGLCYQESKILNLPINIVQTFTHNNSLHSHSPEELLTLFINGLKIDIHALYQLPNRAAHVHDCALTFIKR